MKRLKTGNIRRAMFVGIMSMIFILSVSKSVYAEETGQGMISVALKDLSILEGSISTYKNVEFSLYRVGTTDENGKSAINEEYGITAFPETATEYDAVAKLLKDKVKDSEQVDKRATNAYGNLLFGGLSDGVYLLIATGASNYGIVQPALIHLPYYDNIQGSVTKGQMVREAEVEPKSETVIPTKPGDTTDTTKPNDTTDTIKPNDTTDTTKPGTNIPDSNDDGFTPGPDSTGKDTNQNSPGTSINTNTNTGSVPTGNKVTTTTTTSNKTNSGNPSSPSTTTGKTTTTTSTGLVKTGDETPIAIYMALAGLSLLVLGMVIRTRQENK